MKTLARLAWHEIQNLRLNSLALLLVAEKFYYIIRLQSLLAHKEAGVEQWQLVALGVWGDRQSMRYDI